MSQDKNISPSELRPFGGCGFIVVAVITFIMLSFIISCKTVKQSTSTTESEGDKQELNIDSLVKSKLDSQAHHYEERISAIESGIEFYPVYRDTNNIQYRDTGRIVNTIKYLPGGGIEASGNIKAFNQKILQSEKIINDLRLQKEYEVNEKLRWQDSTNYYKQELSSKKVVKTKFPLLALLFIGLVCFIAGLVLRPRLEKVFFGISAFLRHRISN